MQHAELPVHDPSGIYGDLTSPAWRRKVTLPLDQMRTARPPAEWSVELVAQRVVEAFMTEKRMPPERFIAKVSSWPATPLHTFAEMMHWDGKETRQRVWDSWAYAKGVYAWEVSRMDEAMDWLPWVPSGPRQCLMLWATAKARGMPVRRLMKAKGYHPTSFYRARDKALERIADRLNQQGVQVR